MQNDETATTAATGKRTWVVLSLANATPDGYIHVSRDDSASATDKQLAEWDLVKASRDGVTRLRTVDSNSPFGKYIRKEKFDGMPRVDEPCTHITHKDAVTEEQAKREMEVLTQLKEDGDTDWTMV